MKVLRLVHECNDIYLTVLIPTWGCTVVARLLRMRKVRGSTPRISRQASNGHVFDPRWVLALALIAQR